MPPTLVIFIIALIAIALIFTLVWRFSSRHLTIPCPTWLGWLVEMENPFFRNHRASTILQHNHLAAGMKVLDYGCGPGRLTIPAARQVGPAGSVTAFDIQTGMLERVRCNASQAGLANIEYVQGAAGEGKLKQNEYDRALLVTVLGEIPDQAAALREVFTSLKPGGLLSVAEIIMDPHFQSRGKVRQVVLSEGFREMEAFGGGLSFTLTFERPA